MPEVVQFDPNKRKQTEQETPPDFITRKDIMSMSDADLDQLVDGIRVRRMAAQAMYEQAVADKQLVEQEKVLTRMEKKSDMIVRKLDTINKQMDQLEHYINELRGLRIQAGLDLVR